MQICGLLSIVVVRLSSGHVEMWEEQKGNAMGKVDRGKDKVIRQDFKQKASVLNLKNNSSCYVFSASYSHLWPWSSRKGSTMIQPCEVSFEKNIWKFHGITGSPLWWKTCFFCRPRERKLFVGRSLELHNYTKLLQCLTNCTTTVVTLHQMSPKGQVAQLTWLTVKILVWRSDL